MSFQGPLPSTSSPNNPSRSFKVELGSFLVSLSRTDDMSSLEEQLARLKVAWREEARRTATVESGEGKNVVL